MPPADDDEPAAPRPEPPKGPTNGGNGGTARRRREGSGRGRVVLIVGAVFLVVLITSLRGIASFWTDYLWFDSLDQGGVFTGQLKAKATLVVLFTGIFFLLLWLNLVIADRLAPAYRPPGPEEELIERYRAVIGHRTGLVRALVAVVFALIAGAGTSGQWNEWILFNNAVDFGPETDPLFHRDVGFYVFKLPFLSFAVGWLFASLVIVLIITIVAHYLNGGIRVQVPAAERVTSQVKVHVSVLLALLAIVRAGDYFLQRFELTTSTRGTVDGATYTDVNAQLPATNLLILIAFAAAVLFLLNIRRKGWVLPAMAVGIWAVVAVVGGAIVPAAVQYARVRPAESSREAEYITRNIEATRQAVGLADVTDQTFTPEFDLSADDLTGENATIIDNIRIWDPAPDAAGTTFSALQKVRNFYALNDVDVDRYTIDGRPTQVIISARELNTAGVNQDSWEAKHLTFTHGYGLVAAPTNARDEDGRPSFLLSDIPIDEGPEELAIDRPGLYFGENLGGYVITNTKRSEIDFQDADGTQISTEYSGSDGIGIGSIFRRAAFALRFGDPNPIFSGNITNDSRVLLHRDVVDRVRSLAPFLDFDRDPYPVVIDGHVQWILDAYTTSDRYPYAERAITDGLDGTDLDHRFNYIRNPVKAVVDAYDGSVTLYIVDDTDPIIQAYAKAFPSLFTTDEPPAAIREHFRYPEDMFRVQSNMWGRYHLSDPDAFYTQNDSWVVARDPGRARQTTAAPASTTGTTNPNSAPRQQNRIEPYYVLTRLPGQEELGFQIIRPFVPFSEQDNTQLLTAYLVAESDGDRYGHLTSYRVTGGDLPDGPGIVADSINGNAEVSQQQSLLCRAGSGSECTFGNLILVPIADSLLYVQPLYVKADRAGAPALLERVIVEYQGDVSIGDDLREALQGLPAFSGLPDEPEDPVEGNGSDGGPLPDDGSDGSGSPDDGGSGSGPSVAQLLAQADAAFVAADEALRSGDLATYQEKVDEAQELITEAQQLLSEETGEAIPSSTTTTTEPSEPSSTTTTEEEPQSA